MLIVAHAQARHATAEAAVRALAAELASRGAVRPTFADAVLAREALSPTGLPLPTGAVALPHADPEQVLAPALGVATLAAPVPFRQMGSPEIALDVRLVLLLALPTREDAQRTLVAALGALRDPATARRLAAAADDRALASALESSWTS